MRELKERRKGIRKMPETGDLINSHNYLDILYRLLHEDAISDLRDGVMLMSEIGRSEISRNDLKKLVSAK